MKTETKTFEISYENLEAAMLHFLQSNRLIPLEWDVLQFDMAVPVNDKGFVEFDIEFTTPSEKKNHLKLAAKDGQMTLFDG